MGAVASAGPALERRFGVRGMTCAACERRVQRALAAVPGVRAARVDLATATATAAAGPGATTDALRRAVADAGYLLDDAGAGATPRPSPRPVALGALAAGGLLAFYLGLITLAQDWEHAIQQLADDRWFVLAIMTGFGTQVGLFSHLRGLHARMSSGGVAASTGTSTTAMLACCAHHLTEVLPILGLSGAAIFLNAYKTPLLWLGVVMNLAGVAYLLRQVLRQRRRAGAPADAGPTGLPAEHRTQPTKECHVP